MDGAAITAYGWGAVVCVRNVHTGRRTCHEHDDPRPVCDDQSVVEVDGPDLWVAHLEMSDGTRQKLVGKHHLDPYDVLQALVCVEGLDYVWDEDERGLRAYVRIVLGGTELLAVLYPAGREDTYSLATAYPRN